MAGLWQNRIVGYGDEAPDQLLANPKNAAVIHPRAQQDALTGVLREIGIVQNVVVNRRSGMVVDGHMRIAAAISAAQPSIPVTYVDLSDVEETAILATMDPISAMRQYDRDELDILLKQVEIDDAAVQQMLSDLAAREGLYPPVDPMTEWEGMPAFEYAPSAARTLHIHFETHDAVAEFAEMIGQPVTDQTRFLWHPAKERRELAGLAYSDES